MTSSLIERLDPGRQRLTRLARLYAAGVLPMLALVFVVMSWPRADGLHDAAGATFGHDLSQVWVAGRTALTGNAGAVYDVGAHDRAQILAFGRDAALFSWHYPPVFFLPAAVLAALPYPAAVLAWDLLSAGLMALALRGILGTWRGAAIGLAFPTVFDSLGYEQNGLLTASLLTFGLLSLRRRPYVAGAIVGLVCYKPQLAGLVPLVLLLSGEWRAVIGSAASASALMAASVAAFGIAPWVAFAHGLGATNADIFQETWAGFTLNASAFGAMRLVGGSIATAWFFQALVGVAALGATVRVWRRPTIAAPLRNAVLFAAIPLVSPYVPVYDLTVLVAAGAFFVVAARDTEDAMERAAALVLFGLALDPRSVAAATHVPAGFMLSVGLFALTIRRSLKVGIGGTAERPAPDQDLAPVGI